MYYTDDPVRDYEHYMEDQEKEWERREWEEEQWRQADIQNDERKLEED